MRRRQGNLIWWGLHGLGAVLVMVMALVAVQAVGPDWLMPTVHASSYESTPTGGLLVNGTESPVTSATAGSTTTNTNTGWKATEADDNYQWLVNSSASTGLDVQLSLANVDTVSPNKMQISTELKAGANLSYAVQICDWVSSASVSNAADSNCTGGGWRTLNTRAAATQTPTAITQSGTTSLATQWQIYDGYWSTGTTGGTPVSTPLSNFVTSDASKTIKIRFYSTTLTATTFSIDYLRVSSFIDSVYNPANFANLGSGTPTGHYDSANAIGNSATAQVAGGDDVRLGVPGTAGSASDFYLSYKNVQTYTGMNTIMLRSEVSCSATGLTYRPKIYNFTTTTWVDLTSASIACATTDVNDVFAKSAITSMSDYVSGGEIRIGWRGLASSTTALQVDYAYLMVGSTNGDTSKCEISFGTGTATNCSNTRDVDTQVSSTGVNMAVTAEDESTARGTGQASAYYPFDIDNDATASEEGGAANISMPLSLPSGSSVIGLNFAARYAGRSAGTTAIAGLGVRDYSGLDAPTTGAWQAVGATSSAATQTFTDSVTTLSPTTGYGMQNNAIDFLSANDSMVNMRMRTSTDGASADNNVMNWDFGMISLQWAKTATRPGKQTQFQPSSENLVAGTDQPVTSATAAAVEGVNVGSWKGTLADDNFHWTVAGAGVAAGSTNIDAQLNTDGVKLNGANKLSIQTEVDLDVTAPNLKVQICDWVSTTSVDSAADANCTGGGWRTVNTRNASQTVVAMTNTTAGGFQWHIYDGYWSTGTTGGTPVSTPLTNFVSSDGNRRVKVRYFDNTVNTTSVVSIDFLRISPFVDSVYSPAAFTNLGSGTPAGQYGSTNVLGNSAAGQLSTTTNDGVYLSVPGTAGSVADYYLSFKGVKTFTGANSLLVKADYSCTATGINHRPKIYNFTTAGWEDLTTSSIACSATDATNAWALGNVTLSDYISNGEVRVGWRGLSNSTVGLRLDSMYLMLGAVNTDSSKCEISFGTGTATNCTNTRTLDTNNAASSMAVTAEDESTSRGTGASFAYYPYDHDMNATASQEAGAANIMIPALPPLGGSAIGVHYANNFAGRSAGTTALVGIGLRDWSGFDAPTTGSWAAVGATSSTTANTYVYSDSMTALTISSYGMQQNPRDYTASYTGLVNERLRTTADGASTDNNVFNWDFAMAGLQWMEAPEYEQKAYRFYNNANSTDVGTTLAAQNTAAAAPAKGTPFRLRMLLGVGYSDLPAAAQSFTLQYGQRVGASCDGDEAYTDVLAGSGGIRYYDNTTPSDGAAVTANGNDPTGGTVVNQTYDEQNDFSNISTIPVGQSGMWDFSLVDIMASASTPYCFRAVKADDMTLDTYTVYPQITTAANVAPATPSAGSLVQKKTDDSVITTGQWLNASSIKFTGTVSDTDPGDLVRLCVEVKATNVAFTSPATDADGCSTTAVSSGSTADVTVTGIAEGTAYHWQAKAKDWAGAYSGWSSYGGNGENSPPTTPSDRDFGLDTTAPTGGTVYDGSSAGVDAAINNGTLTTLSANWSGINANASGLTQYEYSIGTTAGGIDTKGWTSTGTTASMSDSALSLQTSKLYYVNVRTTDVAGNVNVGISSNGQLVAPTVSFSVSPATVSFNSLKASNTYTDTQPSTLTTSTNAYGGYVVRSYLTNLLTSAGGQTISMFNGGSYAAPAVWSSGNTGFGYTSSDTSVQNGGVDNFKFGTSGCSATGFPSTCKFAPFTQTPSGDIVADHASGVQGTTVSNEQFTVTYRVTASATQAATTYNAVTVYSVTPIY